jgi:hypothetical protein
LPCYKEEIDLSGVSKAALLKINGGVARTEIKEITIVQISLSAVRLITYSRSGTTDLISKLSELITILNLKRSPKKVPRLLRERSKRVVRRVYKINIRSSTRFLRPMYVRKIAIVIKVFYFRR